jgi:hypothetical protein
LQDERLLAALDLAEAALRAHDDVSAPAGIAERVGGTPPGGHLETWQWLAGFAHDFLYRPRWALWAIDRGLALAPEHSGLRACRLRFLLAAGRAADVLREGHAVWTLQQEPNDLAAVAALVCLAAAQQANRAEQQAWSARTVESYRALPDGAVLGWNFAGNRQAFLLQPDSTRRTKALELFALLEHEKSGDSVEKLIKMRGAPPPR